MATIRLCDWTGERLGKKDPTYVVIVDGEEFEVGDTGKLLLMEQLESDEPLHSPVPGLVTKPSAAPQGAPVVKTAPTDSVETEPHTDESEPVPVIDTTPLEIPDDLKKRLPKPTIKQAEQVLADSKIFDEGALSTLTPGNPQQREAARKLKEIVAAAELEYQGSGDGGFNISDPLKRDLKKRPR